MKQLINKISSITLKIISVCVVLTILLWYFMTGITIRNLHESNVATFNAIQSSNKVDYDSMWKIISQSAQVPKQYSSDFTKAYSAILHGTGDTKEAVNSLFVAGIGMKPPQLDSSLYKELQQQIEAQRLKFENAQKNLLDVKREDDKLRTTFPGNLYLGNVAPLEAQLVTSTRTEQSFATGKDDSIQVFEK